MGARSGTPIRRTNRACDPVLLREEREPIAVDDLYPVAFVHARPRPLGHRLPASVIQPDADHVVGFLLGVLFDLVAGIGAHTGASDGGGGIAAPRTDLVTEHAAHDPAGYCADAAAVALLF